MSESTAPLLEVTGLDVDYRRGRKVFHAVHDVSLAIPRGGTLGLVGESGSGKTTIARAVQGLITPARGEILLDGAPVLGRTLSQRRAVARSITTVFQDPFGSLNPARTIGAIVEESLLVQEPTSSRRERRAAVARELERVGIPTDAVDRRPHEFSGGQRQRIAIARALITKPRLVICDEAVSALDLSVQAQVLNLLSDLQREDGVSMLFITHDLAVVRHVADRVAVLQHGRLVETIRTHDPDRSGWADYTRRLFDAAPVPDPAQQAEKRRQFEQTAPPAETVPRIPPFPTDDETGLPLP